MELNIDPYLDFLKVNLFQLVTMTLRIRMSMLPHVMLIFYNWRGMQKWKEKN